MNWGNNRTLRCRRTAWRILYAGICCVTLYGLASAATGGPTPKPQPERSWESYFGVAILPTGRAIVVGDKGVVMITEDQGKTWTRRELVRDGKYYDLYSLAFTADGAHGWVVGDDATIFRTDDQGTTWTPQKAPAGTMGALLKVAVADAQSACASGEHGIILCTSDGGATWNMQKFQDLAFFDIAMTDPTNAWAVGEFSTVLHTDDAGKSWKVQAGGDRMGKPDPLFAIAFANKNDALAVGLTGDSLITTDGGKTWKPADLSVGHRSFYAVSPVPAKPGEFYAGGEEGMAALITDSHVSPVDSGTSNAITAAAFSPRFALAVGLAGTLVRSDDGGQHWYSVTRREQALQSWAQ